MTDIIERLTENAHVLEAHRYTTAAEVMREAADVIEALRAKLDDARQIADHWERMWSESA